jgi:hypothetical protein
MNKIIEVALTGKFGTETVPSLMEVINITPNPEMATEILLGIYEQPKIPSTVVNEQGLEKTATHIDYWGMRVSYSYQEEVRKHIYVDQDCDTSVITLENYKEFERDYGSGNIKSFRIPTGEIRTRQDSCEFGDWLAQEAKDYSLAV